MKSLITLILIFIALGGYSQQNCKEVKSSFKTPNWLKSYRDNQRSDTIDVKNYSIYLDITDFAGQTISGNCIVSFEALQTTSTLSLDLQQLNVDSVVQNGNQLTFSYNDTLLVSNLNSNLNQGDTSSINVYYHGSPQTDPSGWGGFYFSGDYAFNLGVGFQANPHTYGRTWHPCFDNFAERATYDFNILTSQGKTAYCNGVLISETTVGTDSLITKWKMSDPINSYLASIAVSEYTHVLDYYNSPVTGLQTPTWLIAKEGDTTAMKTTFSKLNQAIEAFEVRFGDHEWNKVGYVLVPFNGGAMEHATNIAFPLNTAGSTAYETLMAHELAHHWWGDLVTCENATEMWINEGMASYSERLFLEYVYDYDTYLDAVKTNHKDVLHLAHARDTGFFALNAVPHWVTYGDHSYNKGADVMHSLRTYMGDSLFFAGLTGVKNAFAGGNINSYQFRDELNNYKNVDDFFDGWIYNPGFAHFSIDSFAVSGSGPYNVEVFVKQKLRSAPQLHDNVPLTITFKDANWNETHEQIIFSGYTQSFNFTTTNEPVFVGINMDHKLSDATTAESKVVNSTSFQNFNYANALLIPSAVPDSAYIRVTHNWVLADNNTLNIPGVIISKDRYWSVDGIIPNGFEGSFKLEFNAQENTGGYLDMNLMQDYAGQTFIEDSLVLLYRPTTADEWTIHPNATLNTFGSNTDKKGFFLTNSFETGQYAFGYKTAAAGIENNSLSNFKLFPNPAENYFTLEFDNSDKKEIQIFDLNGKLIEAFSTTENSKLVNTSNYKKGTYLVVIKGNNKYETKRVVVR